MFNRIDASKSTKGASKLRRDLINAEIANLRDLLPLPPSTRQRLSQLQLMALVCVFLRKANYFQHVLKNDQESASMPTPNIGFSKAMSGFIMMMTQQGKLLYISENAAEYLGHSMEDLLIHGDSVYDVVDKQDHMVIQSQLARGNSHNSNNNNNNVNNNGGVVGAPPAADDRRLFLCRINVSRNSRRQLRFGDQKVVLVEGHYLSYGQQCNRNDSVFLASCTPVVLPETRESVVQGATNIFTSIHSMDMKYLHIDKTAESHLEYSRSELVGVSWYNVLHWDSIRTAYCKHQTVIQSDQERSSTALLRLVSGSGRWFWVHCVLQVKDTSEECQHPIIVCTNQVLSDREAEIMKASSWLYQYSSQSKYAYGVCPTTPTTASVPAATPQQQQHHQILGYGSSSSEGLGEYNNNGLPRSSYEFEMGSYPGPAPSLEDNHHQWGKDRLHVKQEPSEQTYVETQQLNNNTARVQKQESDSTSAEPVDMSINNTGPGPEHDERHSIHCANSEFCHCNKTPHQQHHHPHHHQQPSHQHNMAMIQPNNKSPQHQVDRLTPLPYLHPPPRQSNSKPLPPFQQQLSPVGMQVPSPDNNGGLKYNIVDLDKLEPAGQDPYCNQKRQLLLLHHQTKVVHQPGHLVHLDPVNHPVEHHHHHLNLHHPEQWTSPSPVTPGSVMWQTECGLQRVPDVVHQELSPYMTTPTTPAPTDECSSHPGTATPDTPVSVFNFDWPGGAVPEQHVPNLRVLSFRSPDYSRPPRGANQEHGIQPITLQLPCRKKNLHADRDYAK